VSSRFGVPPDVNTSDLRESSHLLLLLEQNG
jgi:hypothetical protein